MSNCLNRYKEQSFKPMSLPFPHALRPITCLMRWDLMEILLSLPAQKECRTEIISKIHLDYLLKVKPINSAIVEFKIQKSETRPAQGALSHCDSLLTLSLCSLQVYQDPGECKFPWETNDANDQECICKCRQAAGSLFASLTNSYTAKEPMKYERIQSISAFVTI